MSEVPSTSKDGSSAVCDLNAPEGSLYTDFTSDTVPLTTPVQTPQVVQQSGSGEVPTEASQNKPVRPNRKDWIDTNNPLHCKPCDFTAQDMQEFQDHSLSYKHIKKTAEVLEMKVNSKKDEEKKQPVSFVCEVCVCTCNSESAWNSHLLGQKHRKNLEKQGAARVFQKQKMKYGGAVGTAGPGPVYNAQFSHKNKPYQKPPWQGSTGGHCANDFAQYKEPLIGLEYVTEIQVTGQNPRYHCKLCDAKFDHNVKFPHLVGAKHRFNVLKEKSPTVAQEIRVGVKKRSELTGKLLEEAMKIEQQEGRQQVKTCVEASPFETATIPQPLMGHQRANDHQRINPMGKLQQKVGGMKKNPNINLQSTSNYMATTPQSSHVPYYGRGRGRAQGRGQQQYQSRGRGGTVGRGRGRGRGSSNSYGRGFNHQSNQQSFSGGSYQQQFQSSNQPTTLLPQEAFRPRSPPRTNYGSSVPYNYSQGQANQSYPSQYQNYGPPGGIHDKPWSPPVNERKYNAPVATSHDAIDTPASSTSKSSEPTKQNLLENLSDLGKLVNSEEDASIALQVSNALTQALLKYRMNNLE